MLTLGPGGQMDAVFPFSVSAPGLLPQAED